LIRTPRAPGRPFRHGMATALLPALLAASCALAGSAFLPLSEVSPGAVATGRTVFQGTEIDTFSVEIVSVVRDVAPGKDLILARGLGERMERLGVSQGMSGSPVYLNGRLLGAVSSTWGMITEPLMGITPIGQMTGEVEWEVPGSGESGALLPEKPRRDAVSGRDFLEGRPPGPSLASTAIATPLVFSGCDPRLALHAASVFEPWGFVVTEGGSAGDASGAGELRPGSTLGVRLIGGDMNISAIGTATWIDGRRVHGWGHPFLHLGRVEMPLVDGYIHAVIPSRNVSFKMGSGGEVIGTLTGDRRSGISGILGREPRTTSLDMQVVREGERRTYHFDLARSRFLTPNLVGLAASNAFLSERGMMESETVRFTQRLLLDDGRETESRFLIAGEYTLAAVADALTDAPRRIALNPFEDVLLKGVEVTVEFESPARLSTIERAHLDGRVVERGGTLRGSYTLRDWRGEERAVRFAVPVPEDHGPGAHAVVIADAATMEELEAERSPRSRDARDLDELLTRIRDRRRGDHVYIALYRAPSGVLVDGRELPRLPRVARSVIQRASRSDGGDHLFAELVSEQSTGESGMVLGAHILPCRVKREKP
jgi:hypothetical protein